MFIFSDKSVFDKVLIIKSFFSFGNFFSFKNAIIFLIIISQSLFHSSIEDLKSDFSRVETFQGIHKVAIIEAATK